MQFPITSKTLREDAQTAEMELIAVQYRGRARVLQAKLFVPLWESLACQFSSFRFDLSVFAQTENCAAVDFSQSNCAIACSLGKALHASFLVLALTYRSLLKLKTVPQ